MEGAAEAREDAASGGMAAPAPGPAPTDGFFLEPAPEPELPKGEGASKKRAKDVGLSVEIPVSPRVSCPSPSRLWPSPSSARGRCRVWAKLGRLPALRAPPHLARRHQRFADDGVRVAEPASPAHILAGELQCGR